MPRVKTFSKPALIVGLIALGMGIGFYSARYYDHIGPPERIEGFFWPNPKQIYPFVTVDHHGQTFNLDQLQGKWSFIFFGYTHCPDICPITLTVLAQVYDQLAKMNQTDKVQVLFVTADPERDTPEQLQQYVTYFNKNFIGLGGNPAQIQSLAIQLGAVAHTGEKTAAGDYLVDHSASIFLTDPRARLVSVYTTPHEAGPIVKRFLQIKDFIERQTQD